MSDWVRNLLVLWMALVIFGFTYLLAVAIFAIAGRAFRTKQSREFTESKLPDNTCSTTVGAAWKTD